MKEIIIIVSVLLIILGSSIYTQKYIEINSDEIINELEELRKGIDNSNNSNDRSKMSEKSKDIYNKWKETSNGWSAIVLHNELDMVETSLIRMKSAIGTGEVESAMEELEVSVFLLKHISDKEKFSLKNVF